MTETPTEYNAGKVEDYYWVECKVRLPGERSEPDGKTPEFACLAKVQCADVIDALNLDRWTAQAFQYIWRSGRKKGESHVKELAKASWFLHRGVDIKGHWHARLCDVIAKVIEAIPQGERIVMSGGGDVAVSLARFVAKLREREIGAVRLVAESYGEELIKEGKPEGKLTF